MKKTLLILLSFFAFQVSAQDFEPIDKSIMDVAYYPNGAHRAAFAKTAKEKAAIMPRIRITYSRPLANGREIFGGLVKFEEPWRMGANESTEIIFYSPVMIGQTVLSAGRYSLYCVPTKDSWTLKVHPTVDGWGSYGYDYSKDLASVTANVINVRQTIEALSIAMYKAESGQVMIKVGWGDSMAEFPITVL